MGLDKLETTVHAMRSNTFCSAENTHHAQNETTPAYQYGYVTIHMKMNPVNLFSSPATSNENEPGELI